MAILSRNDIKGLFVSLLLVIILQPVDSQSASLEQVKMAFVFNFSRYVTWPESVFKNAESPFTICLDANQELVTLLELTVKGEKINNRNYQVKTIKNYNELNTCQIFFISAERYKKKYNIPSKFAKTILYVSDSEGFASDGGMIELKKNIQKIKLLVNLESVKSSDLRFRSNLLNLMTIVK